MEPRLKSLSREDCLESWTAGLDWYRYIVNDLGSIPLAREKAEYLCWEDEQLGGKVKPWRFQGYEGWQSDRIRWGERSGSLLWESSGATAQSTRDLMPLSGGYSSRLDLQVTLRLCTSRPGFGHSLLGSSPGTLPHRSPNQTQCGLAVATNSLWLGTVGRRTSPSYMRIYDKGVESRCAEPGRMWRVELECKRTHSRTLSCNYPVELTRPSWCAAYCVQHLKSQGLYWPFGPFESASLNVEMLPKEPSTAGKLALWLTHSVAPVVPRLLTVFTVGEVLKMLNLSDVAVPTGRDNAQRNCAKNAGDGRSHMARLGPVRDADGVRVDSA